MAKSLQKIKALSLRKSGKSIKDIAKNLEVSQSTVSVWCRDIKLSSKQQRELINSKKYNITAGRLKGAFVQRMKRLKALENAKNQAQEIKKLGEKELFAAGIALYLAEGSKTGGVIQFTNRESKIVKFMMNWFQIFFKTTRSDFKYSLIINSTQKERERQIMEYWTRNLNLITANFTKTRFIKTKHKKIYSDPTTYFGTFNFRIKKSTNLLYLLNAYSNRLLELG